VIDTASAPLAGVDGEGLFDVVPLSEANMDPLEIITEGCWLAVKFGLHVSPVPTSNLRVEGGVYWLGRGKSYHPLETVLVDVAATGDWRQDVATALGVEAPWINGFLDGFDQRPESSADGEYVQGHLAGEELRVTRYRRELPDRG
jgi:hypothetical protein